MTVALLFSLLWTPVDDPTKLRLVVQLDTGAKDGIGRRKLTPDDGGAFAKSLETLDAVKSAYWKNPVMTVEIAPGLILYVLPLALSMVTICPETPLPPSLAARIPRL